MIQITSNLIQITSNLIQITSNMVQITSNLIQITSNENGLYCSIYKNKLYYQYLYIFYIENTEGIIPGIKNYFLCIIFDLLQVTPSI